MDNGDENLPPMECEADESYRSISDIMEGRRIVNLGHVLKEYGKVLNHKYKCTMGRMDFIKETRKGLISYLHFYCDNCGKHYVITTDCTGKSLQDVNNAVVWGSLSVGIGHSQCEELLGVLEIPFMTPKKFVSETHHLKKVSYDCPTFSTSENVLSEKNNSLYPASNFHYALCVPFLYLFYTYLFIQYVFVLSSNISRTLKNCEGV